MLKQTYKAIVAESYLQVGDTLAAITAGTSPMQHERYLSLITNFLRKPDERFSFSFKTSSFANVVISGLFENECEVSYMDAFNAFAIRIENARITIEYDSKNPLTMTVTIEGIES